MILLYPPTCKCVGSVKRKVVFKERSAHFSVWEGKAIPFQDPKTRVPQPVLAHRSPGDSERRKVTSFSFASGTEGTSLAGQLNGSAMSVDAR